MPDSERWFSFAYAIWLFGIFAYFIPAATWNPVSRFDLTRAIVEHRSLSIDAYSENTGDRAFAGDHWYTDKTPIPSFAAVPVYAAFYVGEALRGNHPEYSVFSTPRIPAERVTVNSSFQRGLYVCSLCTAGLGTAILGVLLFGMLARRFSSKTAFIASAGTVLGTPLLPYATSFYGHGVAAALLTGAFAMLFGDPSASPSRNQVRIAGACLALAVGCEYLAALPGFLIAVSFLVVQRRPAALVATMDLGIGSALPLFLLGAYHTACFGGPLHTGYSYLVIAEFSRGHSSGFMGIHTPSLEGVRGLLFGPLRGLFFIAPISALALGFGVREALRTGNRAAKVALLAFSGLFLANAGYYMWWGGAASGPRHLVPCLGFLAFGAAAAWDSRYRWFAGAMLAVSVANFLVLTGVGLEAPDHGNTLFDYAYPRFLRGDLASLSGASNLGIRLGLAPGASLGPVLVWMLLGARFLLRQVEAWVPDESLAPAPSDSEVASEGPAGTI